MKTVFTTAAREFSRIQQTPLLWFVDLALPLGVAVWLLCTYLPGSVRELPVVVVDQDQTSLSRMLSRALDATAGLQVVSHEDTPEAIVGAMRAGRAQGGVVLPQGLSRQIKRGENAALVLYENAANIVIGNTLAKEVSTISRTISGGISLKRARAGGLDAERAHGVAEPVHLNTQVLFNPTYSYLSYMVPGLIAALLQLFAMLSGVLALCRESVAQAERQGSAWRLVLGRALPHWLLLLSVAVITLALFVVLFHGEPAQSAVRLVPLFAVYLSAAMGVGLALASWLPRASLAVEVTLFLSTPAFILSGLSFPLEAMPAPLLALAELLPFTHYVTGALTLHAMNQPLQMALPTFAWLLGVALVTVSVAVTKQVALQLAPKVVS